MMKLLTNVGPQQTTFKIILQVLDYMSRLHQWYIN